MTGQYHCYKLYHPHPIFFSSVDLEVFTKSFLAFVGRQPLMTDNDEQIRGFITNLQYYSPELCFIDEMYPEFSYENLSNGVDVSFIGGKYVVLDSETKEVLINWDFSRFI